MTTVLRLPVEEHIIKQNRDEVFPMQLETNVWSEPLKLDNLG